MIGIKTTVKCTIYPLSKIRCFDTLLLKLYLWLPLKSSVFLVSVPKFPTICQEAQATHRPHAPSHSKLEECLGMWHFSTSSEKTWGWLDRG